MLTQHDDYEALCALAVSGQLTPDALEKLNEHMQTCVECQHVLSDFRHIAAQVLPEFASEQMPLKSPPGMTARFIARMHSEGIPLARKEATHRVSRINWSRRFSVYAVAASVAATLVLIISLKVLAPYRRHGAASGIEIAAARSGAASTDAPKADLLRANLTQQLDALRKQVDQLTAELISERRALEFAHSEKLETSTRLSELEKSNTELRHDLADRDTHVAQLNAEAANVKADMVKLASSMSVDEFLVQADQSELNSLRAKVASLTEELNESQQLSAAANQAKDLIVARNLHIVDVDDTDGAGRRQRPFGRIFYSEGKNLVFYAYDLSDPRKVNKEINFYVWGSQEGVSKPVKSLGIFHADDAKAGRWVLRFDDPSVLAQINCVFVTAESGKKAVMQPTGKQILFASLGSTNHP